MATFEVPNLAAINTLPTGLLYPHQADGVSFLISKGRAILGDDMGLGKTRQAIVGMQVAAPTGMVLVVCPASLKLNWRREIRMVDPDAKIEVLGVADGEQPDPRDLMRPFPADLMRTWPISTRVNKPENDDPSVVEPIKLATNAA